MARSSFNTGRYVPSEGSILHQGRFARATDRLLLVCHGRSPGTQYPCLQWSQNTGGGPPHLLWLAERGWAVLCIDSGGNLTWGNDLSIQAAQNAVAWARANGVCDPNKKVAVMGYSMGGLEAFNYANAHAADVAGVLTEAGATDIDHFHPDATYGPEIDAAYPGASYPAGYGGHSPITYAGAFQLPVRMYHAQDDPTVPIAQSQAMIAALGSVRKELIALPGGGHAGFWGYMDVKGLEDWLNTLVY